MQRSWHYRRVARTVPVAKNKRVFAEARVLLPGTLVFFGFQSVTMLLAGFDKVPPSSRYVHGASLALTGLSIILLMLPAAYHRLVVRGEDTEHVHRITSDAALAAIVPLALGIAGDFFVAVRAITASPIVGLTTTSLLLVLCYGMWFGVPIYRRIRKERSGSRASNVSQ